MATDTVMQNDPNDAFAKMTDEEIVLESQQHDNVLAQEYLLHKYRNFVRAKARSYFLIGAEREDIIQEGMIGLYKAIRDFRADKQASFRAFAELCVTRQIITAIKTATRQKHIPLNSYVSLNKPIYEEDSDRTLLDVISGVKVANPEDMIISREEFSDIESKMNDILSDLEWKVLMSYLDGKSYQEIAAELGRHIKSIDNALQRILKAKSPGMLWSQNRQRLDYLKQLLQEMAGHRLWRLSQRSALLQGQLSLLDPSLPVERGYSMTFYRRKNGRVPLRSCREINIGETILTRITDGEIESTVTAVYPQKE